VVTWGGGRGQWINIFKNEYEQIRNKLGLGGKFNLVIILYKFILKGIDNNEGCGS
jgi:hypothetical protein